MRLLILFLIASIALAATASNARKITNHLTVLLMGTSRNVRRRGLRLLRPGTGFGLGRDKEYIDSHEGLLIDAQGAAARYLRLGGNGNTENDLNHCTEIEVYGRKATAP